MSTAQGVRQRYDTEWPLAGMVGLAAGLLRPLAVAVLAAGGVSTGPLELALQYDLPFWWAIHLTYSFAFGAIYGLSSYWQRLRPLVRQPSTGVAVGLVYGVVLWAVNFGMLWRLLTEVVFPFWPSGGTLAGPLVGHLVYGAVLGAAYPVVRAAAD